MAGLYDVLVAALDDDGLAFFEASAGSSIELRETVAQGEGGKDIKGVRILVDGKDLLFADEDGSAGVYEHERSFVAGMDSDGE